MRFGVVTFVTDYGIDPVTLGRAVEERGFESLFVTEHTHIPTSRESPWPGGGELPRKYAHTYDPFVALSAAAAVTRELILGTGVCLVVERDPITLAKEVASLDRVSGGRFQLGVGAGWNREEMANHGTDPRTRMALLDERVQAMKRIWTHDEAAFHGRFVDFDPIWTWPKPVQRPHPPVIVGGMGPSVLDRVLEIGDEWMPLRVPVSGLAEFGERVAELQRRAAAAGRAPVPVTLFGAAPKPEAIPGYAEAGVTRCLFELPDVEPDEALRRLDQLAEVARAAAPAS